MLLLLLVQKRVESLVLSIVVFFLQDPAVLSLVCLGSNQKVKIVRDGEGYPIAKSIPKKQGYETKTKGGIAGLDAM